MQFQAVKICIAKLLSHHTQGVTKVCAPYSDTLDNWPINADKFKYKFCNFNKKYQFYPYNLKSAQTFVTPCVNMQFAGNLQWL